MPQNTGGQNRGDPLRIFFAGHWKTLEYQWLASTVRSTARSVRDEEAVGSNPAAPTICNVLKPKELVVFASLIGRALAPLICPPIRDWNGLKWTQFYAPGGQIRGGKMNSSSWEK